MILNIEKGENNKILRSPSRRVEKFDDELRKLAADMKETLGTTENGIGLAAPQVDKNIQLFVISPEFTNETNAHLVYINPEISRVSRKKVALGEGCLSLPDQYDELFRAEKVTIKAQDEHGNRFKVRGKNLLARLFMHEVDHLKGILYIDYL